MKPTLRNCYFDASASYLGVGRLLQQETDAARSAAIERAQWHLEQGHQILGRLMEEEPMPSGIVDFFRCLLGMENWRSRRPEAALAERLRIVKAPSEPGPREERTVETIGAGQASAV